MALVWWGVGMEGEIPGRSETSRVTLPLYEPITVLYRELDFTRMFTCLTSGAATKSAYNQVTVHSTRRRKKSRIFVDRVDFATYSGGPLFYRYHPNHFLFCSL